MGADKKMKRKQQSGEEEGGVELPRKKVCKESSGPDFFQWLLGVSEETFFNEFFEKDYLHCSHHSPDYFTEGVDGAIPPVRWSTEMMKEATRKHAIHYGSDVSVVRFDKQLNKRVSFKTEGILSVEELTKCMANDWSVRFLRPHEHFDGNAAFIGMMEKYFRCYCGLNSYWTPADSQGFAPHYDDVDVFLLQMEGEKEWRLYEPLEQVDYLARHSSEDYIPEQFPTPMKTLVLKAGDVLYMPRGMVHQGRTFPHTHSLHITFSANQMNSWADLMRTVAQYSIECLASNDVAWRETIPRALMSHVGAVFNPEFRSGCESLGELPEEFVAHRDVFLQRIRSNIAEMGLLMTDETNIDFCVDEYAKEAIRKMQPTAVYSAKKKQKPSASGEIEADARVKLISDHACRLVLNTEGEAIVYHNCDNSVVCLAGEMGMLRFEREFAPAIATLISSYPKALKVAALPFPDFEDPEEVAENQAVLCEAFQEAGILVVNPSKE